MAMARSIPHKRKLLILGAGAYSQDAADLADQSGEWEVVAFVEGLNRQKSGKTLMGFPIMWIDEIAPLATSHWAICAIGSTHRQALIGHVAELGFQFGVIRHPGVSVSKHMKIGYGSVLSGGVVLAAHCEIGRHVILNRGSLIGHHTKIGDYCTISPGANIAGGVSIGTGTYVGMGAIILNNLSIGSHSVIGAGAVVIKDVPDQVQVIGIPAKITKENIEGK